jgi:histone deacetylase 11
MDSIHPNIVYTPDYDFYFYGFEKLHPFDGRKPSKVWNELVQAFQHEEDWSLHPVMPVAEQDILEVHTTEYLALLASPDYVIQALEVPALRLLTLIDPHALEKHVLQPMRWATQGTIDAAEAALKGQIAVNLGGGYHHASQEKGEGFCIYSDIAIAVARLRKQGMIRAEDRVLVVDLDAHQSNGLERIFFNDPSIYLFDMYNQDIYPQDRWAQQRINCAIRLSSGTGDQEYHAHLEENLPRVLQELGQPRIAFYVAGTDIYANDPLGRLNISAQGVFERDRFVFETLTNAGIPWVMTLAGGYTKESYLLVLKSVCYLLETWGWAATRRATI